jgi:hypothetical protein
VRQHETVNREGLSYGWGGTVTFSVHALLFQYVPAPHLITILGFVPNMPDNRIGHAWNLRLLPLLRLGNLAFVVPFHMDPGAL